MAPEESDLFRESVGANPDAPRKPSDEERALFRAFLRDVRPLQSGERRAPPAAKPASLPRPSAQAAAERHTIVAAVDDGAPRGGRGDVGRRTAERLRRGRYPIDIRVDLHGMTAAQAQSALFSAIERGWRDGKRCILLITGRGGQTRDPIPERDGWRESRTGVIKSSVPGWIDTPPHRERVLALAPARKQHGGHGAFYLLLRRKRT